MSVQGKHVLVKGFPRSLFAAFEHPLYGDQMPNRASSSIGINGILDVRRTVDRFDLSISSSHRMVSARVRLYISPFS